jgi:anti-sigma factor RsiW
MMSDQWTARLSEYVDGDMSPDDRERFEAHLGECADCREVLDDVRAVVRRADALDDAQPRTDLWPGIAARIGATAPARPAPQRTRVLRGVFARRVSVTVPQLLAAGLGAVVLAAGGMWMTRGVAPAEMAQTTGSDTVTPVSIIPAALSQTKYDLAVADLEGVLERERESLDPATVRIVEESLETVDRALEQARQALLNDPESDYLRRHLEETTRQKLDLLRRVTAFTSSS